MIYRATCWAVLALATAAWSDPPRPAAKAVTLEVVKWAELERAIAARKGQVVVIDIWADFCIPCKKEFPHFVELHQKYAAAGLACISVSVDDADDRDRTIKFLKSQNATMTNFLIDESADVWQTRLDATVPPNVIVLDRSGRRVKRFSGEEPFTYQDVEKVVKPLLDK